MPNQPDLSRPAVPSDPTLKTPSGVGLLDHAPFGFAVFDDQWRLRYVNAAGARLAGREVHELVGHSVGELFPEAEAGEFRQAMLQCRARGEPVHLVARAPVWRRWFEMHAFPFAEGVAVHFADVSATQQERVDAERDRQDLRRASRIAGLASFRWSAADGVLRWSPEYYALLGIDPAGFTPTHEEFLKLVHPEDLPVLQDQRREALQDSALMDVQFRVRHADGTWRMLRSLSEVEYAMDGSVAGIFGTVHDRTDEHQAEVRRLDLERQVQQAQKLESLGVLAGGIAHDFNNLLVGILANASLAKSDIAPDGLLAECLDDIEQAARRAADLTNQLLAYAGKGKFVVESVSLSDLVAEMLTLLRAVVSRRAELHLDLQRDLPLIAASGTQMRQVIMNLLTNASDALEDRPGTIVVRTGVQDVDATYRASTPGETPLAEGRYVFVEIADTGAGMDAETVARIFDPFFTTKLQGRGLGLAATLGIVRGHNGAIRVYSQPGKGTTFKLLFPVAADAVAAPRRARPVERAMGRGTVLVIDDEETVRRATRQLLAHHGFDVLEAVDGAAGLALFRAERARIDLVLLDLTMPRVDGEEAFRQLRQLDPAVRVVLMSGYNAQNVTAHFVGKGLAGFVQKPFDADALLAQVCAALER